MQLQSFDLISITEVLWNSSHDWNVVMKGYTLFRRDRPGRHSGGIALFVQQHLECIELCLGVDDEQVEGLWAQIKEQVSKGDTAVGTYYRLPDKVEEGDEAFSGQLGASSKSQA